MRRRPGFTLIELLVVIAIIAILASLLLPTLSRAKAQGQKAACISNFRQLHLAWHMYTDDNEGHFPFNDGSISAGTVPEHPNWVGGALERQDDWLDNTNVIKAVKAYGGIGAYLKEPAVFKCPSDKSTAKIGGRIFPRVRSLAMNSYFGGAMGEQQIDNDPTSYHYYTLPKLITYPPVENACVFIDTHEDSIETGLFLVAPPYAPGWNHFPASRHSGGATISFSDGHVVCHRWVDARTHQPVTGTSLYGIKQPGNPDIRWLQERATLVKPNGFIYQ